MRDRCSLHADDHLHGWHQSADLQLHDRSRRGRRAADVHVRRRCGANPGRRRSYGHGRPRSGRSGSAGRCRVDRQHLRRQLQVRRVGVQRDGRIDDRRSRSHVRERSADYAERFAWRNDARRSSPNTDGSGNNFCQTVLDDESAGASIQTVVSANAPFTGSYKPNQALSGFDGEVGNGTWNLGAQDFFSGGHRQHPRIQPDDHPGRLQRRRGFLPVLTATKTVAGPFLEGGVVTYTITITNTGTGLQADNAGNEFTDTLPAQLTVGTPTASAGTISGAGVNPVTWNGSSLAPLAPSRSRSTQRSTSRPPASPLPTRATSRTTRRQRNQRCGGCD